jgi:hypothetical protein
MEAFSYIAREEAELVMILEDLDLKIKDFQRKIDELNLRMSERTKELLEVRNKMKTYLENELGVNIQN